MLVYSLVNKSEMKHVPTNKGVFLAVITKLKHKQNKSIKYKNIEINVSCLAGGLIIVICKLSALMQKNIHLQQHSLMAL